MPNDRSAISILDFAGPLELANFLRKLVKNHSAYEEYLTHKLGEQGRQVTNRRLLEAYGRDPMELPNEFGNYVGEFECFVCRQIHARKVKPSTVTRRQYDCPLPRDPVTGEIAKRNWWTVQWNVEKCGAKLLAHCMTRNISINISHFDEQKMYMYDNKEC